MKIIRVTYTPAGPICDPDTTLGYQYDHNAVQLQIAPPECPDSVSFYRLDWELSNKAIHSTEPLEAIDGVITYTVPSALTVVSGEQKAQLKAFRQDGTEIIMIAGTKDMKLYLNSSVPGGEIPPEDAEPLAQAIADCREATDRVNAMMPILINRTDYDALVAAGTVQAGRVYYITEG